MNKRDVLIILAFILIVVAATVPMVDFYATFHHLRPPAQPYETVLHTIELLLRQWLGRR